MSSSGTPGVDLVPLGERMRMISAFRAGAVALILLAWLAVPVTRGEPLGTVAAVSLGYLAATLVIEALWRWSGRRAGWIFGVLAMCDGVFLAWASFGTAGLDSPLVYLLVLQLITVSLLASFRTGVKLAVFNACVLVSATYVQESGRFDTLGGVDVRFGDGTYRHVLVLIVLYVLVAAVTTGFAALNERELRRRRYDLEALARFALQLEARDTAEEVADCLLAGIADIYDCEPGAVLHQVGGDLRVLAARGAGGATGADAGTRFVDAERSVPVVAGAIASGETVLIGRAGARDDAVLAAFGPRANVVVIPLRDHDGSPIGGVVVEHPARRGSRIERRVVAMLERFVSHASLALSNAELLKAVRDLAVTDGLTGLPNRRHLDEFLDRACAQLARGQGTLALMMIDIDHFKKLNDTHGHQVGDDVLRVVGRTLDQNLRAGDVAARYGGEEFCVVMPGASRDEAATAAERLRRAIEAIADDVPHVTASIGVAYGPDHGVVAAEITERADRALYDAKRSGRNLVTVAGRLRAAERAA